MRGSDLDAVIWRVRRIRDVYEPTQNQEVFARRLGIGLKSWSSYETNARISLNSALKIVQTFPELTLDWIYLGRTNGIAFDVLRALEGNLKPAQVQPEDRGALARRNRR